MSAAPHRTSAKRNTRGSVSNHVPKPCDTCCLGTSSGHLRRDGPRLERARPRTTARACRLSRDPGPLGCAHVVARSPPGDAPARADGTACGYRPGVDRGSVLPCQLYVCHGSCRERAYIRANPGRGNGMATCRSETTAATRAWALRTRQTRHQLWRRDHTALFCALRDPGILRAWRWSAVHRSKPGHASWSWAHICVRGSTRTVHGPGQQTPHGGQPSPGNAPA
jgi:hypothetical protein